MEEKRSDRNPEQELLTPMFRKNIIIGSMLLASVICLMTGLTFSRYGSSIKGYASIAPGKFYSSLMGDQTSYDMLKDNYRPIQFGNYGDSDVGARTLKYTLRPGVTDEDKNGHLYFTIRNGKSEQDITEVEVQYSLRVILTKNLPLSLNLIQLYDVKENSEEDRKDEIIGRYGGRAIETTLDDVGDAYVYRFYKYKTDAAGNYTDELSDEEMLFTLGTERLEVNRFGIQFQWNPEVKNPETGEITYYNSAVYAKELELVEVRASLVGVADIQTGSELVKTDTYAGGYFQLTLPQTAEELADPEKNRQVLTSSVRVIDLRPVTEKPAGTNTAEKKYTDYSFTVRNAGYNTEQLAMDVQSNYTIRMELPDNMDSPDAEYTLICLDEKDLKYQGQVENHVLTFRNQEGEEPVFKLRKKEDVSGTTDTIGYAAEHRYRLIIENDSLYESIKKAGDSMTDLTNAEMKDLAQTINIRLNAEYTDPRS